MKIRSSLNWHKMESNVQVVSKILRRTNFFITCVGINCSITHRTLSTVCAVSTPFDSDEWHAPYLVVADVKALVDANTLTLHVRGVAPRTVDCIFPRINDNSAPSHAFQPAKFTLQSAVISPASEYIHFIGWKALTDMLGKVSTFYGVGNPTTVFRLSFY